MTSVHNYLLRSMIRGDADATVNTLRTELRRIRLALGADDGGDDGAGTAITVVTHPIDAGADQIARAVAEEIRAQRSRRT